MPNTKKPKAKKSYKSAVKKTIKKKGGLTKPKMKKY